MKLHTNLVKDTADLWKKVLCSHETIYHGIMLWGYFSLARTWKLVRVVGKMDAAKYNPGRKSVRGCKDSIVRKRFIFKQNKKNQNILGLECSL